MLCNLLEEGDETCEILKSIPVGPIAGGSYENLGREEAAYSEVGVKQLEHLAQITITQQF